MTPASGGDVDGSASVVALIPLRLGGKSRLGGALTDRHRVDLVLAMLDDVLAALRGAGLTDVRILAGDASAAAAARARGLTSIADPRPARSVVTDPVLGGRDGRVAPGDRSLRAAVDAALVAVGDASARLVVAADLPRLLPEEVRMICAHPADVAVAPTSGGGTALLRLAPRVSLAARYGPASARAHLAEAERHRRTSVMLDLPGAHHDVDAEPHLAALDRDLDGTAPGAATAAFLAGLRG